jgi:hypothetical protein
MTNNFCIYALGQDFDVDAYRTHSAMSPSRIWYRGQPKSTCTDIVFPTSGIHYDIGDGRRVPYPEQEDLAIDFLAQHQDELKRLGKFPGVSYFNLGLELHRQMPCNPVGFTVSSSPRLMRHALEIGCRVTHYVWARFEHAGDVD